MLFIPQEIKEKLDNLQEENKRLTEENHQLKEEVEQPRPLEKKRNLNLWTIGALVVALVYIIVMHIWMLKQPGSNQEPVQESPEAVLLRDGKIEKWNAAEMGDVVYRVQLGAYEGFDLNKYKQNIDGLHQDSIDGYRKVSLGAFSRLEDAQDFLKEMVRLGLENTYIVAYKNDEPIGLIEAKNQE